MLCYNPPPPLKLPNLYTSTDIFNIHNCHVNNLDATRFCALHLETIGHPLYSEQYAYTISRFSRICCTRSRLNYPTKGIFVGFCAVKK